MTNPPVSLPWSQPGWIKRAVSWIDETVTLLGLQLVDEVTQPHVRPWSTVLQVPTNQGILYFKATAPMLGHEAALTQSLARWRPDCMPVVLATDLESGWFLMRGSGVSLRSLVQHEGQGQRWQRCLTLYAQVQVDMIPRAQQLLDLNVLDRGLVTLPDQLARLLEDVDALCIEHEDGLSANEYNELQAHLPRFRQLCTELANYGIPETLHHDDFHDGNIFFDDTDSIGRITFADWGESCVAHPFFSLVVGLRSAAYTMQLQPGDPALDQLRDAYLRPWSRYAGWADLQAAFALANRIGMVNRALTWYLVVSNLQEPYRTEQADAVPGWLHEYLTAEKGLGTGD
ncbi:phosphotransferase [bacterium]|nr:phosphotransferase [bacterium]